MKDSNPVSSQLARFIFAGVAIFIFGWTASLTYTFVGAALPDMPWYVPLLALVVFDVGMIAWMFVFLHHAKGIQQRAIALVTTIFDLLGVGLMVLAEILLGGQTWATAPESIGEYAIWGIATWTIGNLAAVVAFHLSSPEARQQMAIQNVSDEIFEETLQELRNLSTEHRNAMAQHMSKTMFADLEAKLASVLGEDYTKSRLQSPPQIPTEAPTNGAGPNMRQLGFDAPNSPQGQRQADLPPAGNGHRQKWNEPEPPAGNPRPVKQSTRPSSTWDDDEPSATITFDGNYSSPHEFMTEEEFRQYWNDGMTPLERAQADLRRIEMEEAEQAGREWQAQHREQRAEQRREDRQQRLAAYEQQKAIREAAASRPAPPAPELPPASSSGRAPGSGKVEPGK